MHNFQHYLGPAPSAGGDQTLNPSAVTIPILLAVPVVVLGVLTLTPDAVAIPIGTPVPTAALTLDITPDEQTIPVGTPIPTIVLGNLDILPDPVEVPVGTPVPTIVLGVLTLTPDAVAIPVAFPVPAVDLQLAISPDSQTILIGTPVPVVVVDRLILPDPVAIPVATPIPTIDLQLVVTPSPVTVPVGTPVPTVDLQLVVTPDPQTIPIGTPVPTVDIASAPQTIIPDPVTIPIGTPVPTAALTLDIAPDAVAIPVAFPVLAVVLGNLNITPSPQTILIGTPVPVVVVDRLILPDPVAIPVATPIPTIDLQLAVTPSPVTVPVGTPVPAVDLQLTVSPSPQTIPIATPAPTVQQTSGDLTVTPSALSIPIVIPTPLVDLGVFSRKIFPDPVQIPVVHPLLTMHVVKTPAPVAIPVGLPLPFLDVVNRRNPDPVQIQVVVVEGGRFPFISVILDQTKLPDPVVIPIVVPAPIVALQSAAYGPPPPPPPVPLKWMPRISSGTTSLLKGCTFRFATLWRITTSTPAGAGPPVLRFTNHNESIVFEGNTYEPAGGFNQSAHEEKEGLKSSNFSVRGVVTSDKITEKDLRAGFYREAEVKEYIVDWRWPWAGVIAEQTFWIEDIEFDVDSWKAEMTGITNRLRVPVGRRYEFTCQWRLGEGQCANPGDGVDLLAITEVGSVVAVTKQRKIIETTLGMPFEDVFFQDGLLIWFSGGNAGLAFEVRAYEQLNGKFYFHIKTPFDIEIEDSFTVYPGCDKRFVTCKDKFDNVINYGGFNKMPLTDEVIRAPEAKRA